MKHFAKIFVLLASIVLLFSLDGCFLFPEPKEELPPATQIGANTFGFLLNGQVWLPKGNNGTPNLRASYDPTYMEGAFTLSAYRYYDNNGNEQYVTLYIDSLSKIGTYYLYLSSKKGTYFYDDSNQCTYFNDSTVIYKKGSISITKLDYPNGVASGTFEFTLFKSGCGDTIKVTQGRFDVRTHY